METFVAGGLPDIDQQQIKRGLCPWCLCRLHPTQKGDKCPECGDEFVGPLNIED